MATAEDLARSAGPPRLLCVGFFRTGTASLESGLYEIGFQNVFHGLRSVDKRSHWAFMERAALAKWPHILTPDLPVHKRPRPFTREDWDELFGPYDALTDFSCVFAEELIAAYPEAKVILTTRDVDRWYASFEKTVLSSIFSRGWKWFYKGVGFICSHRAGFATEKMMKGYFGGADDLPAFRKVSKKAYEAHYERIKAMVPEDRLLEYRVGKDGWEPLCKFLGKPVPERRDFPFVNEGEAYDKTLKGIYWRYLRKAFKIIALYFLIIATTALLWWLLVL